MHIMRVLVRKSRSPTQRHPNRIRECRRRNLEHGKSVVRTSRGSTERRPSNTEIGSYESKGLERKDAARRLAWAWEQGHLMRMPHSHLTRQSRET